MFLKTVPPAAAIHSQWRSSKSCSRPLCFNDSASQSDLASESGTSFPQKIQMIIESLQSSQSSDMSEHTQAERAQPGHDSDSDDSVDRGIEEAIQEYLKENKRRGDQVTSPASAPKLQRREAPAPLRQTPSSANHVHAASNPPLKKKAKKKKKSSSEPEPASLVIKEEESSSDDGIEEEIQKFQQEKRVKDAALQSDSSSDEGIEEAIRLFQEEKKSLLPPPSPPSRQKKRKLSSPLHRLTSSLKVNTAELMCAEAILDISKTVMPVAFQLPPPKSEDSSVDSEDGIEQEIRKFLELKAKTSKEPVTSAPERKTSRLSLSKRRKLREHQASTTQTRASQRDHGSDKSSSLDSDQDLDAAIKDLLTTKKKVKKKVRELNARRPEQKSLVKVQEPRSSEEERDVDSDDSIEQEIRRFLAERAKVSLTQELHQSVTSLCCEVQSQPAPGFRSPSPTSRLFGGPEEPRGTPVEDAPLGRTEDPPAPHHNLFLMRPVEEPSPVGVARIPSPLQTSTTPGSFSLAHRHSSPPSSSPSPSSLKVRHAQASVAETRRQGGRSSQEQVAVQEEVKCVDETDVESEERSTEEMSDRRKTLPDQLLSTSIDPGLVLSPYIALDTNERRLRFQNRRCFIQTQLQNKAKRVKRRLSFWCTGEV